MTWALSDTRRQHHLSRSAGPIAPATTALYDVFRIFWIHGTTFTLPSRRSAAKLLTHHLANLKGVECMPEQILSSHSISRRSLETTMGQVYILYCQRCARPMPILMLSILRHHEFRLYTVQMWFADAIFACSVVHIAQSTGTLRTTIPVCQWQTQSTLFNFGRVTECSVHVRGDRPNLKDHLRLPNILVASDLSFTNSGEGALYLGSLLF